MSFVTKRKNISEKLKTIKQGLHHSLRICNLSKVTYYMAKENFAIPDDQYRGLQEACFKNWLQFESSKRLFEILSIIGQCWSIHSVLGEYRLMQSVDPISFQKLKRDGRLTRNFRHCLSQY